jgi:hypothetical protein
MNIDDMSREQLAEQLKALNEYMDNIIVFWGGKKEFMQTFRQVASNREGEYTADESRNAKTILESEGAFDEFIELVRDSFERGGINYVLSEKVSAIMQEVAERRLTKK